MYDAVLLTRIMILLVLIGAVLSIWSVVANRHFYQKLDKSYRNRLDQYIKSQPKLRRLLYLMVWLDLIGITLILFGWLPVILFGYFPNDLLPIIFPTMSYVCISLSVLNIVTALGIRIYTKKLLGSFPKPSTKLSIKLMFYISRLALIIAALLTFPLIAVLTNH